MNLNIHEEFKKIASFNGIEVFEIRTAKFKTNSINIFLHDTLSKENATKNALVPAVLRRGCERLPTMKDIALYLEELYGATFDCGVVKKGERQILHFYMEHASDKYTSEASKLFLKCFDLLLDVITRPVLENGVFKTEYIEQEKENLKRQIESRVNEKLQYAVDRCLEEMCKDEPFGVYEYGTVNDLSAINGTDLYNYYQNCIETLPISVFIAGDVDEGSKAQMINRLNQLKRKKIKQVQNGNPYIVPKELRNVVEKMNVNQGKLSLGFRTGTAPTDDDYYRLMVYNGILGGGIHSKLFQNVREKASLAYYAFSRLEKFKGLMVISSGIEIKNYELAYKIMLQQLDEMKNGNISDYEFSATMKTIDNGIRSLKDSQLQMVDFYLSQAITGTQDTLDTILEKFHRVTNRGVVEVAGKIKPDLVYFLTSNQNNEV